MPATGRTFHQFPPPRRGVVQNLETYQIPQDGLADSLNVIIDDSGKLTQRLGYKKFVSDTVASRPLGAYFYRLSGGGKRLVVGTKVGWEYFDVSAQAWANISGTAMDGTDLDLVRFTEFMSGTTNWLISTNNINTLKKWDGLTATYVEASTTNLDAARDITVVANRLVVANVNDNGSIKPDAVVHGAINDIDGLTTVNIARLPEVGSEIIACRAITRTNFVVYGDKAQMLGAAQLGTSPFKFEVVAYLPPPASTSSLVRHGSTHYWMARDGSFWSFDGINSKEIGREVRRFIEDNIDAGSLGEAHGTVLTGRRPKLIWFFPKQGTVNNGVIYEISDKAWFPFQTTDEITASAEGDEESALSYDLLSGTYNALSGTYDAQAGRSVQTVVLAQAGGEVYRAGGHLDDDDGTAMGTCRWTSGVYPLATLDNNTRVDWIDSYFQQASATLNVNIQPATTDNLSAEDPTFDTAVTKNVNTAGAATQVNPATTDLKGLFVGLRHTLTSPGERFYWRGAAMSFHSKGRAKG